MVNPEPRPAVTETPEMVSVPDKPHADTTSRFGRIALYRAVAEIDAENLRQCHRLVEEFLVKAAKEFEVRVETEAGSLPKEERGGLYESYSGEHWQLSEVFPETLRSSLFKTAYTLLEVTLNGVCKSVQTTRSYTVSVNDMKGKGITRAKLYLEKVAQVPFPAHSPTWHDIQALAKVRNILTHDDGAVPSGTDGDPIRAFAKAHPGLLEIDRLDNVVLSGKFVPYALDTFEAFLKELYAGLKDT